jgi:tetratricopeptide (TPR) repeat protein
MLAALLLAPFWGAALMANGGFWLFQQHDWQGAARLWMASATAPGPGGEWARLAGIAATRAGDTATATQQVAQAVAASPHAPLVLLQQGNTLHAQGSTDLALEAWRQAGATRYFCTQAAQALYHTTPPDLSRAVDAATVCTALDPTAGDGWLILGQAEAASGRNQVALPSLDSAYDQLLRAGQPGRAAVAAATAAEVAHRLFDDAAAADRLARARALAPTVCADPARPQDPTLDALCAHP